MKSSTHPYRVFVGIDRSDAIIDLSIVDPEARFLGHRSISSRPRSLRDWILELRQKFPQGRFALCIEQPCANLAAFFSQYDFLDLFLINPATFKLKIGGMFELYI